VLKQLFLALEKKTSEKKFSFLFIEQIVIVSTRDDILRRTIGNKKRRCRVSSCSSSPRCLAPPTAGLNHECARAGGSDGEDRGESGGEGGKRRGGRGSKRASLCNSPIYKWHALT
jgi:hypothetical protein